MGRRKQEEGGRKGGNERREGGREGEGEGMGRSEGGREGAREEAMMLCRERASVEEERVERRRIDEGNERGRDGTGHGRCEGRRKRAEDGLSEEGRGHWSKGERGISREVVYIHKPTIHKPALALDLGVTK